MRLTRTCLLMAVSALLVASCGSSELVTLPDIDTSGSPDGIVDLPDDVPEVFHEHFVKYTYFPAPNGKRIHILASDGWTRDQIKHGRNVMQHLLTDLPGSIYGDDKSGIANAMADRKATMVFFNTEEDLNEAMRSGLPGATDLSMQDLRANESPAVGDADYMAHVTRDAAYEEIWHLIHDYNDLWTVPPTVYEGRDIEPDEIPEGHSHFGQYFAGSRPRMEEKDPLGFALVRKFVRPYLTYTPELPLDFSGTFSMAFDPDERYTMKTQHLRNAALTGDGDANLRGNVHDNVLTGNAGANRLEGGGGSDTLDGGGGEDTAVFGGPAADCEVTGDADSTTVSDSQPDRDGADVLRGVELLQFSDGVVQLER